MTDLPFAISAATQERIAQAVVVLDDNDVSQERVHELLTMLCQLAFADGAQAAINHIRRQQ